MKQQLIGEQQKIKNIIYGKDMDCKELGHNWHEQIEEKRIILSEYVKADSEFNNLLKQIGDSNLSDRIRSVVEAKECAYAYVQYTQGLFEGVKSVLSIRKTGN